MIKLTKVQIAKFMALPYNATFEVGYDETEEIAIGNSCELYKRAGTVHITDLEGGLNFHVKWDVNTQEWVNVCCLR